MSRHRVVLSRHQTYKEAQAASAALSNVDSTVSIRRTAHGFSVVKRNEVKSNAVRPVSVNAVGDGPPAGGDVGSGGGSVQPRQRGRHRTR